MINSKKLLVGFASFINVLFLTNCDNKSNDYRVSFVDSNGLILSAENVKKGRDYFGEISIEDSLKDNKMLPRILNKISVGKVDLTSAQYSYTLHKDLYTANLYIPRFYLNGDVLISLTLEDKPFNSIVSETEFENALCFEDISYLQVNDFDIDERISYFEYTPEIYHEVLTMPLGGNIENYVIKQNEEYKKYSRFELDSFYSVDVAEEKDLKLPQEENLFDFLKDQNISFDKFDFIDGSYCYINSVDHLSYKYTFDNKRLIYAEVISEDFLIYKKSFSYEVSSIETPLCLKFEGDLNICGLEDEDGNIVEYLYMDKGTSLNLKVFVDSHYYVSQENQVTFKVLGTEEDYKGEHSYNPQTGIVSINVTSDVAIKVEATNKGPKFVNKEEYEEASSWKENMQYLQRKYKYQSSSTDQIFTNNQLHEFSPTVYHCTKETHLIIFGQNETTTYSEYYIVKNGNSYTKYYKNGKEGSFTISSCEESEFKTIKDDLNLQSTPGYLSYDQLNFNGEFFVARKEIEQTRYDEHSLEFDNLKPVYVSLKSVRGTTTSYDYTYFYYVEKTPEIPNI